MPPPPRGLRAAALLRCRIRSIQLRALTTTPSLSNNRNEPFPPGFERIGVIRKPTSVAILGGGISGLSTAFYLSQLDPTLPITILESSKRLGGWISSTRIKNDDGTSVTFETGPRTLRPWTISGLVTIDMIRQLELETQMLLVPRTSQSAQNRFIYYPDRLAMLPTGVISAIRKMIPLLHGGFGGALLEPFRRGRMPDVEDESVAEFFTRRINRELVDNLITAVLHGIYAGDAYQLSMKSLFPALWRNEGRYGSILGGLLRGGKEKPASEALVRVELMERNQHLLRRMEGTSVYTFRGGMETLVKGLKGALKKMPNVTIRTGFKVDRISEDSLKSLKIASTTGETQEFSNVISTLFAPVTNALLPTSKWIPELGAVRAVNVMVVNLYYTSPSISPVRGFGYLIPRATPESQNPEKALGVVFDSDSIADMKPVPPIERIERIDAPGTTLTVMLGGHYWDNRATLPTPEEGIEMAKAVVRRHLKITDEPALTNAVLQRDCIPQYTVGHSQRMAEAHRQLVENFNGRLSVVGASYAGVGMNDCVAHGRDVAMGLYGRRKRADKEAYTGLEKFVIEEEFVRLVE